MRGGGDFAGDNGKAGGDKGFAGNAPPGVLLDYFIENSIGNLVGNLVRVSFRDRLRSKQKVAQGFAQETFSFVNRGGLPARMCYSPTLD
jgi:hypothetical protein